VAPPAPPTTVSATAAESRDAASRLLALLSDFDPSAADFAEAHGAALQPLFLPHEWQEFVTIVKEYGLDEARARLEAALESFSAP
jgi:hypothetical protein